MFKFRGFRASLDFITGKQRTNSQEIHTSVTSIGGAYKVNREEFGRSDGIYNPPRSVSPSMVKLPHTTQSNKPVKSKSTSDLVQSTTTVEASRSTQDLSQNTRASKRLAREQKKLEKQQLEEQKKQEKAAAKERERQEKLAKKARERNNVEEARKSVDSVRSRSKKRAPMPPRTQPVAAQKPQISQELQRDDQQVGAVQNRPTTYSTNTLDSSISRSSGPPPYGEYPEIIIDDPSSNITFSKPVDYSSWDLISEHREQIGKPGSSAPIAPKRKKDLQYRVGNLRITSDGQTEV